MQSPLTIVHTEASVSLGGQGLRILNESHWMREQGHRLIIIAPAHSGILAEARQMDLEYKPLPFTKSRQPIDLIHLTRYLRQLKPDVLNTHSSVDSWVGCLAGRLSRVPAIIRTRHLSSPVHAHMPNRWLYRSLSDHIFTTGNCTSEQLIADLGLKANRVSTVSTGIQPPEVMPDRDTARQAFISDLKLPSEARFIGCLAVLRDWKGHSILLEAFSKIASRIPHYHLLIIGEGSQREILERHIADKNLQSRAHLLGHRRDIWPVLRALDIKVLASTGGEGISQALLQAQFTACPVIGSDAGGTPEIIRHAETGLLVPKGEVEPLSNALLQLIQDRDFAMQLAQSAYLTACANHTIDVMGHKILSIYHQLLATN